MAKKGGSGGPQKSAKNRQNRPKSGVRAGAGFSGNFRDFSGRGAPRPDPHFWPFFRAPWVPPTGPPYPPSGDPLLGGLGG